MPPLTEQAVQFPQTLRTLVGVVTSAESHDQRARPAVVLLNAGLLHRVGPNRLYVRIAREVARRGFASLRFDLSGIGDSLSRNDSVPLRTTALHDVQDAFDYLAATEAITSFLVIGLCSGADLAFRAALADRRVVGAVLIDGLPYRTMRSQLHDQWQRVLCASSDDGGRRLVAAIWCRIRKLRTPKPCGAPRRDRRDVPGKHEAEASLHLLVRRGVKLLMIYTSGRGYSYERQFADLFPSLPPSAVQVEYFRDAQHTFSLLVNQDRLVRTIEGWVAGF